MISQIKHRIKNFTSSQRKGILILLFFIAVIQISFYFYKNRKLNFKDFQIDEVSIAYFQNEVDSLKKIKLKRTIYPFNPNFIDDKKGYFLKMKPEEIDRLLAFRKLDKYVNSAKDFQKITGVSNEWLAEFSSSFKFPEWTQKGNLQTTTNYSNSKENHPIKDINTATAEDLILIKGIGHIYAERILNERNKHNGFVDINQVRFVYGLPPEVIISLKKYFKIGSNPTIKKTNINTASKEELLKIPYITNQLSREILIYRSKSDDLLKIEDLKKIKAFPLDKINIITLYLTF